MNVVNFNEIQTRMVLEGNITQIIIPFNDMTMNFKKGDIVGVSFGGIFFKDYKLKILKKSVTSLKKISREDMFKNGFLYKPFFYDYMLKEFGVTEEDTVIKLDFEMVKA